MQIIQQILLPIMAWIMIISGTIMLIWPEAARKGVVSSGGKNVTWWLILAGLFLASILGSLSQYINGLLILAGIIGLIIAILQIRKAAILKLTAVAKTMTIVHLRSFALFQIIIGILTLIFRQKII